MDLKLLCLLVLGGATFVAPCLAQSPALPPSTTSHAISSHGDFSTSHWSEGAAQQGDCTDPVAVGNGEMTTIFDSDAGGREFGQSFIAPCTGLLDAVVFVLYDTGSGFPSESATMNLLLFEGSGMAGVLIASEPYTVEIPTTVDTPVPHRVSFSDAVAVVAGETYSFFVDQLDGDVQILASSANYYADGGMYTTVDGDPANAVSSLDRWDLTFRVDFLPSTPTANESAAAPATFSLSAIYPNPLRSSATVSLEVSEALEIHVAVYDVLGRKVAVLVEGAVGAGSHEVALEAGALPAGTYVLRMTTGSGHASAQRFTVVR